MKNPHAVALGRNGGKARKKALSPERRSEIALKAITARWDRVRAARAVKPRKRRRSSKDAMEARRAGAEARLS